jgi:hypothetical protein
MASMNSSLNSTASFGGEGDAFEVEGVQAHDAEADGAVAEVGGLGGLGRVEVDVDDVVERADGDADGLAELLVIEGAVGLEVVVEDDGAEVADGGLVAEVLSVISVQRLELWMTPTWSCGERTLQGSLKVIQGWPVSKSIESIFFQSSRASISCAEDLAGPRRVSRTRR